MHRPLSFSRCHRTTIGRPLPLGDGIKSRQTALEGCEVAPEGGGEHVEGSPALRCSEDIYMRARRDATGSTAVENKERREGSKIGIGRPVQMKRRCRRGKKEKEERNMAGARRNRTGSGFRPEQERAERARGSFFRSSALHPDRRCTDSGHMGASTLPLCNLSPSLAQKSPGFCDAFGVVYLS